MTPTQIAISVSICVHGAVFGLVWFQYGPPALEPTALTLDIVASPVPKGPRQAKSIRHSESSTQAPTPRVATAPAPEPGPVQAEALPAAAIDAPVETTAASISPNRSTVETNQAPDPSPDTHAPTRQAEAVLTPPSYSLGARLTPKPIYPSLAWERRQGGKVVVHAWVDEKGVPIAAKLKVVRSSGYPLLDDAAVRTVLNWRFTPARLGEVAVPGDVQVTFEFDSQGTD